MSWTWIGHRPFDAILPLLFFVDCFATPEVDPISRAGLDLVFLFLVRVVGLLKRDIVFVFLVASLVKDEPVDCNLLLLGGRFINLEPVSWFGEEPPDCNLLRRGLCINLFETVFELTIIRFGCDLLLEEGKIVVILFKTEPAVLSTPKLVGSKEGPFGIRFSLTRHGFVVQGNSDVCLLLIACASVAVLSETAMGWLSLTEVVGSSAFFFFFACNKANFLAATALTAMDKLLLSAIDENKTDTSERGEPNSFGSPKHKMVFLATVPLGEVGDFWEVLIFDDDASDWELSGGCVVVETAWLTAGKGLVLSGE